MYKGREKATHTHTHTQKWRRQGAEEIKGGIDRFDLLTRLDRLLTAMAQVDRRYLSGDSYFPGTSRGTSKVLSLHVVVHHRQSSPNDRLSSPARARASAYDFLSPQPRATAPFDVSRVYVSIVLFEGHLPPFPSPSGCLVKRVFPLVNWKLFGARKTLALSGRVKRKELFARALFSGLRIGLFVAQREIREGLTVNLNSTLFFKKI